MHTQKDIIESFELFFQKMHDRSFTKSKIFRNHSEQKLLPIVRAFLLGYFGNKLEPEAPAKLPGTPSGKGRFDFIIDGTAVELAVRNAGKSPHTVSSKANVSEIKKLLKYDGPSILVLFDFSKKPYTQDELQKYREHPSLGKGPNAKYPFTVAYFKLISKKPIETGKEVLSIHSKSKA